MTLRVLIVYAGQTTNGSTATLASYIKTGADSVNGVTSLIKTANHTTKDDVLNSDAIILGSGDYNGNPEPDMINFIDNKLGAGMTSSMVKLQTMPFGVFATSGGYSTGAQEVLNSMARSLMTFGCVYVGGSTWYSGQGIAGMTEKSANGGWEWANANTTQKYLKDDACEYGRRIAVAALTVPQMAEKLTENPSTCQSQPPHHPSHKYHLSKDARDNIIMAVVFVVLLIVISILWKKQGFGNIGFILSAILVVLGCITAGIAHTKGAKKIRQYVAIVISFAIIAMMITDNIYDYKHNITNNSARIGILSVFALLLMTSIILGLSISTTKTTPPGPKPPPELRCSNVNDCPNTALSSCVNNVCTLKDSTLKNNIANYLDSIYPDKQKLSSMLSDVELYNFFMTLGYYWLSYNSPNARDILKAIDSDYQSKISCGGYFVIPSSDDIQACGSVPDQSLADIWPCDDTTTCSNPCCKPGSLSIPPVLDQLYFYDYITKTTGF